MSLSSENDLLHETLLKDSIQEVEEGSEKVKNAVSENHERNVVDEIVNIIEEFFAEESGEGQLTREVKTSGGSGILVQLRAEEKPVESISADARETYDEFRARCWSDGIDQRDLARAEMSYALEKDEESELE